MNGDSILRNYFVSWPIAFQSVVLGFAIRPSKYRTASRLNLNTENVFVPRTQIRTVALTLEKHVADASYFCDDVFPPIVY